MKISIISIIDNVNIGTYLQAYALAKVLERLGHKPEYVNYSRPSQDILQLFLKTFRHSPLRWPGAWIGVAKRAGVLKRQRQFIKDYLSTRYLVGYTAVKKNPPSADIYMTGSDQVWNSAHNGGLDKTFFVGYAPVGAKIFSYAASIGMENFPAKEQEDVKQLLSRYKAISVREVSAIRILSDLGIDKSKLHLVLDPTFLISKEDWKLKAKDFQLSAPYVLCYYVSSDMVQEINRVSQYVAKKKGFKIVLVTPSDKGNVNCDIHIKNATPQMFLSLFLNASYVVAGSFHGTAFSINFQKDFVSILPCKFTTRVESLLSIFGLEDRMIGPQNNDLSHILTPINYTKVTEKLDRERERSMDFLKSQLE